MIGINETDGPEYEAHLKQLVRALKDWRRAECGHCESILTSCFPEVIAGHRIATEDALMFVRKLTDEIVP